MPIELTRENLEELPRWLNALRDRLEEAVRVGAVVVLHETEASIGPNPVPAEDDRE